MKFSIITPTFRRKDLLVRAVESLVSQTYEDWEMIIVNDSPQDESYLEFNSSINDPRIHYHVNTTNQGVNYCRNFALNKLSADSKWVIFLDDDDYLSPDALQTFHTLILLQGGHRWFVTNRANKDGSLITKFPKSETFYNYAWEYLISKRLKGDATHCIETKLITQNRIRFSKLVKQGEEWFFFYCLGIYEKMYYHDHNSTITDGYATSGLNYRKRSRSERFESMIRLGVEGYGRKVLFRPSFMLYLFLRILMTIVR